ncbi:MAG: hypothetical protein NVS3B26_24440 [Mycobacteriales bacterium]
MVQSALRPQSALCTVKGEGALSIATTTVKELEDRTEQAFAQFTNLLHTVGPDARLTQGSWTSWDVAAHLLTVLTRYTRRDFTVRDGLAATAEALTTDNARELRALGDVGMAELLRRLDSEFDAYRKVALPLEQMFPFHGMQQIDGAGARSNVLGELLIHGYDLAVSTGRAWPLQQRDLLLVLNGALQVAGAWLKPEKADGLRLDVALHVRGGHPQVLHIADGTGVVRDLLPSDRPDSVIKSPAVPLALLLYGRLTLPAAIRRGVLIAGGRRPWTGLRVPNLFLPV